LFGSVCTVVQVPPQATHVQAPFTHVCPAEQALPQPPQLPSSTAESKHAPEQQTGVTPAHVFPHAPQLATSFWVSRGVPEQQTWPSAHSTPHAPQFMQSLDRSVQVPLQHPGGKPP
jgi:hypothetical protein